MCWVCVCTERTSCSSVTPPQGRLLCAEQKNSAGRAAKAREGGAFFCPFCAVRARVRRGGHNAPPFSAGETERGFQGPRPAFFGGNDDRLLVCVCVCGALLRRCFPAYWRSRIPTSCRLLPAQPREREKEKKRLKYQGGSLSFLPSNLFIFDQMPFILGPPSSKHHNTASPPVLTTGPAFFPTHARAWLTHWPPPCCSQPC